MKFKKLFEPVRIKGVRIKNRIAMAPMYHSADDPDGTIGQRIVDYYTERAKGGVGLIITSSFFVENKIEQKSRYGERLPLLITPGALSPCAELTESVHYYGAKIFIQLDAGFGRNIAGELIDAGIKPISASAIPSFWRPNVTCKEATTEEVEKIVLAFGPAAEIVAAAGFDGIELCGHEGYLFDNFTTAIWNKRTDKYGGELEDRLRFPIEILEKIKDTVGKDFPVTYRYTVKHFMKNFWTGTLKREEYVEAGRDIEEGLEVAKLLEKAGFDALHVDAGCYESMYWAHPPMYQPHGCLVDVVSGVKKVVKIPVLVVGRLGIPELAEKLLKAGKADIIVLGRALLADPYFAKKVQEGRLDDIRPCIGGQECLYRIIEEGKFLGCAVNPATMRERVYALTSTEKPKKVVVVGGGVAGMEAARVASIRGHKVTLYERTERLGGQLIAASVPDFKQDIKRLLNWHLTQLKKLKVKIILNTEVTPQLIKREKADITIIATGSTPIIPNILGAEKPIVVTCVELLLGKKGAEDTVTVVGGGPIGCETALWLAKQGKSVTIVEKLSAVATGIFKANRDMLLQMLAENNVRIITNVSIQEVTEEGLLIIDRDYRRKTVKCDTVVLAMGLKPNRGLYESLVGEITELYAIGDCKEPRKILHAIWEGYNIARII